MRTYGRAHDQFASTRLLGLMSALALKPGRHRMEAVVTAATAGDESAFSQLVDRHRDEVQAHAYRMLRSHQDAEDLTQETFLRAWHRRKSFRGESSFRAWLYRIATNACLTALDQRSRRLHASRATVGVPTEPRPDSLLEGVAATDAEPDDDVASRETIELAFLAAVQNLPPRQRTVLFLCDALGLTASETAELLETSRASVTSALQRARLTLREHLPARRLDWSAESRTTDEERALLQRCLDATERADAGAFAAMLREHYRSAESSRPHRRGERRG
jgi:RNA polymerase sigma-70 factor (ECF subfamily)